MTTENKATVPGLEFGPAVRMITAVDGRKVAPLGGLETKAAAWSGPAPEGVPDAAWAAATDAETVDWMAVPDACVSPKDRRAAEIAVEAARLELPGLPERITVRYMQPYTRSTAEAYADLSGAEVKTFPNVRRTGGTYFCSRGDEVWVSIAQDVGAVAHYAVHECVHLWRSRVGTKGMTQAEQEREADALGDRLLPLIVAAAQDEGGLT